ncbi:MAG: vancomycin high temperature exclusion protein [Bacteroidetes bacterium]|nr:vancomycin high temperature exclusion protein [Bacteroidota bacterium]
MFQKIKVPFRTILKPAILGIAICVLVIALCDFTIERRTEKKVFTDLSQLRYNEVGLLLGTSPVTRNGNFKNPYYVFRINAAVELYKAGKIKYILISGDNGSVRYDEPTAMKEDLIKAGIPEDHIFLDYAGFRTLDSVVRCKEIFGQDSVTIISQKFHNQRAVFLAEEKGLKAIGFNAKDVSLKRGIKTQLREKFARVKLFIDLAIGIKPHFLGEPEFIGEK